MLIVGKCEAARYLGCTPRTIFTACREGRFPMPQKGAGGCGLVWNSDDLDAWRPQMRRPGKQRKTRTQTSESSESSQNIGTKTSESSESSQNIGTKISESSESSEKTGTKTSESSEDKQGNAMPEKIAWVV